MSAAPGAWPAASLEPPPVLDVSAPLRVLTGTAAMARAELQKLRHDQLDIFTRSVQPLLWLFVFGTALSHNRVLSAGAGDYRLYLVPGVMAQAALFIAIFFGLAVIWERDVGQLQRLLAKPLRLLGALALLIIGTGSFACLSMLIAALVRSRERFMGIGQLVMMPLFFASSALYPLSILPGWLHVVARINPLTYEVQGLRSLLTGVGGSGELWLDFLVVIGFFAAMVAAATRAYPRAIL